MPLNSASVGATAQVVVPVDSRWLMAYSAGVGCSSPRWLDTCSRGPGGYVGVPMHLVFPVAPEWALMTCRHDPFALGLTRDEVRHGIHAWHEIEIHRPIHSGDTLRVKGEVVGMRQIRSGTLVTFCFCTVDESSSPVITTMEGMVYLGVILVGPGTASIGTREVAMMQRTKSSHAATVELGPEAAHIYTECAHIWNPIHTDVAVARAVGLEQIILHGTATLAAGVTAAMTLVDADPSSVRRVGGRFSANVQLPSTLTISMDAGETVDGSRMCNFDITRGDTTVLQNGFVVADTARS